jgi:hypothetical protein
MQQQEQLLVGVALPQWVKLQLPQFLKWELIV